MGNLSFSVRFPDVSTAQANQWAAELKESLLDAHPEVVVSQSRERSDTMDLGSILEVTLNTVVVPLAVGVLQVWLQKRMEARAEVKTKKETFDLDQLDPELKEAVIAAIQEEQESGGE